MNPVVQSVFARLVGRPAPESLPPVSQRTIARAESTAAESAKAAAAVAAPSPAAPARPAPTPALLAKPRAATPAVAVEGESPAVTALRLEVQQLRLMRTLTGSRALAALLRESEAARAALDERVSGLQTANESLTRELHAANTRLRNAGDATAVTESGPRP